MSASTMLAARQPDADGFVERGVRGVIAPGVVVIAERALALPPSR